MGLTAVLKLPRSSPGAKQTQKSLIDSKKAQNIGMCLFMCHMFAITAHISAVLCAGTRVGKCV